MDEDKNERVVTVGSCWRQNQTPWQVAELDRPEGDTSGMAELARWDGEELRTLRRPVTVLLDPGQGWLPCDPEEMQASVEAAFARRREMTPGVTSGAGEEELSELEAASGAPRDEWTIYGEPTPLNERPGEELAEPSAMPGVEYVPPLKGDTMIGGWTRDAARQQAELLAPSVGHGGQLNAAELRSRAASLRRFADELDEHARSQELDRI